VEAFHVGAVAERGFKAPPQPPELELAHLVAHGLAWPRAVALDLRKDKKGGRKVGTRWSAHQNKAAKEQRRALLALFSEENRDRERERMAGG
jgi:hypothetical protein